MMSYLDALAAVLWSEGAWRSGYFFLLFLLYFIPCQDLLDIVIRFYLHYVNTAAAVGDERKSASMALGIPEASPYQIKLNIKPYAILVSVRNVEGQLGSFLRALGSHRDRLWVFDDDSTDGTLAYLRRENLRVLRTTTNCKKPCAIRALLRELPNEVTTVIVVDPDCEIPGSDGADVSTLERVVHAFQQTGMAALCPRLVVNENGTTLESLQALEYDLAFSVGRKSMGDHVTTSGVGVYRRDALAQLLEIHSLSVYAEDLENTFLLLGAGERIYFDERLTVQTECPDSWRWWFSQRVGWAYGLLRVYISRGAALRGRALGLSYLYQYYVYFGLYAIILQPLRLASMLLLAMSAANGVDNLLGLNLISERGWNSPSHFAFVYSQYSLLIGLALLIFLPVKRALAHLRVLPLYVLYVMVNTIPTSIGYLNWFTIKLLGIRIYRDHYDELDGVAAAERP